MTREEINEKSIFDTQDLRSIKKRPDILANIRFDVTPKMIMEPRFLSKMEDIMKVREIAGYVFYIETECYPPAVMLLKIDKSNIATTIGKIDEVPQEMIQKAIENPVHKPEHGMYAITEEIKEWLRKELNI